MITPQGSTRQRIVDAAQTLFYADGIRAVSVDAVAEKAGVTKRTLYYHFASKDELIAAYLEGRDAPNLDTLRRWSEKSGTRDPASRIHAIFEGLARAVTRKDWRGCGFLRTAGELANMPGHPAIRLAQAHKLKVENLFYDILCKENQEETARTLARQIILLLDGCFALVMVNRDAAYVLAAGDAARQLIAAASSPVAPARK